ncbi:MAG: L-fucose/L-arabinose isomerase family protein [Anaerolineae bacterium]
MEVTLGLIVGNRGFFPKHLCESGRAEMLRVLNAAGFKVVALGAEDTPYGSVESLADAQKCADLFKQHRDEIAGVVVTLPNFGDERAVANTLRWAGLDVPVLVHAFPDEAAKMTIADRRDSFCGKLSVCNNLTQYGIPYSLTTLHTVPPTADSFLRDLQRFAAVCRIVRGFRNLRIGVLGARPAAFNTVRFSEKLLELSGISVETLDLSEAFGRAAKLADDDARVKAKAAEVRSYVPSEGVPDGAFLRLAKFGIVLDDWMAENRLAGTAIQCWTSMEQYYGVVPCAIMSMLSDRLMPSACETDAGGLLGMYAMQLASGKPSALVDWNNNYGEDSDKCVLFHCSNWPKSLFSSAQMDYQAIIAGTVGQDNTYGTIAGRAQATPFTFCRAATDDVAGEIVGYVGEGELTNDPLSTFGGVAVAHIPGLQDLLRYMCEMGFEHHVAINPATVAAAVAEAWGTYLDWEVYQHNA